MLVMLQNVALGRTQATPLQVRAAIAAVQYTHTKRADGGKRDAVQAASQGAEAGTEWEGLLQPNITAPRRPN